MAILNEIFVATRTSRIAEADTEDLPVLVVRRGADIVFSRPLYGGSFRTASGAGAVWRFDTRDANVDSAGLTVELHASHDDAWSPEHMIVWGVSGRIGDQRVIPLAAFLDLATPVTPAANAVWISTDTTEGERVLTLLPVERGRDGMRARRLIVIAATSEYGGLFGGAPGPGGRIEHVGTAGPVTLQGGGGGRLFLDYTLPATPQGDLAHGEGAFYVVHLAAPFSRNDLEGGAFTLTIGSEDSWKPDYFAVFGVDTVDAGPRFLIPYVAASASELRQMSSDPSEGWHSILLPTAKVLPQGPIGPDSDIDDTDGVIGMARLPHSEDRGPRPTRRAARGGETET
jgi:hypothetical protein